MDGKRVPDSAVVPAIGTPGSLSVVRSLGRHGVRPICVSEKRAPPSFSSRYCEETQPVHSPKADLDGYREALLALAERDDVGTIVPVRELDVYVLSKHRPAFAEHVGTPWPTFDKLNAVHDRNRLFAAAERAGVSIPETTLLTDVTDWDHERIVKGRFAILTADHVDTVAEGRCADPPKTIFLEPGVEPDVDSIISKMGHDPIAQEFVAGTEFCLRALYHDGEPVATSQKKLIRGYKYFRGPSVYHEAVDVPELEAAGLALLDELDWHGFANVGFIRDHSGDFKLLEVNPRFGSANPVDIFAGIDYPYYYWQLSQGQDVDEGGEYRSGIASHLIRGEVAHLHNVITGENPVVERPSIPGTVWNIATSLLEQPNFDYFSLDDPGPFVRDVINVTSGLIPERGSVDEDLDTTFSADADD